MDTSLSVHQCTNFCLSLGPSELSVIERWRTVREIPLYDLFTSPDLSKSKGIGYGTRGLTCKSPKKLSLRPYTYLASSNSFLKRNSKR